MGSRWTGFSRCVARSGWASDNRATVEVRSNTVVSINFASRSSTDAYVWRQPWHRGGTGADIDHRLRVPRHPQFFQVELAPRTGGRGRHPRLLLWCGVGQELRQLYLRIFCVTV